MKKLLTAAAAASLSLMAASTAFAGGPAPMAPPAPTPYPVWYVGAGATWNGVTDIEINVPGVAGLVGGTLAANSKFNTGWHVFVGANTSDHFGVELNYTYLGDATLTPSSNNPAVVLPGTNLKFKASNFSAYGTYRHMLFAPWFYFMAKLGIGWTHLRTEVHANGADLFHAKTNSFGLVYGAGMGANFGAFGLRVMYTKLGINDHLRSSTISTTYNPDMLDLSAIWFFGS